MSNELSLTIIFSFSSSFRFRFCENYSFKLHNSNRPISMKSDVIRKRARHEAMHHQSIIAHPSAIGSGVGRGRSSTGTPSGTSPSVSRSSSPEHERRESQSVERYPPLPNSPGSSNGQSANAGQPHAHQPEKVASEPDPYDPSQAAFNFPADHGQFDFPNSNSPAIGQLELGGHGAWAENHQVRRAGTSANNFGGGFNEYGDYGNTSNFPGPFHPDYLRSLGVNIGGWDYGGRFGVVADASQNMEDQKPIIGRGGGISVDTNMDRSSKRRRLSTDSYASSIASATDPPSSASSMFPLGDASTASFSSHHSSYNTHRRNQSSLSTQSSELSHLSNASDFSLDFFKHMHPGDTSESDMMSLLNINHEQVAVQVGIPSELYHPPVMLPFADNYPEDSDASNAVYGPPNGPNSHIAGDDHSSSAEDFLDVTMSNLFATNSQY